MAKKRRTREQIMKWKSSILRNRGLLKEGMTDEEIEEAAHAVMRGYNGAPETINKRNVTLKKNSKINSEKRKNSIKKSWHTFLTNQGYDVEGMDEEEIRKKYYEIITPRQQKGRGRTKEERKESYRKGIIAKGVNKAIEIGKNPDLMTEKQLFKLSGLTKKQNHRKKTEEEKREYRRNWKITHLVNFFEIKREDFKNWTDHEIAEKYREYLFVTDRLRPTPGKSSSPRYKRGFLETKFGTFWYRSQYEKDFLIYLNQHHNIKSVDGNLQGLPYINIVGEKRYYFPDFVIYLKDGRTILTEIKAKWMLSDKNTKLKLERGKKEAKDREWEWLLITEDHLFEIEQNIFNFFNKEENNI